MQNKILSVMPAALLAAMIAAAVHAPPVDAQAERQAAAAAATGASCASCAVPLSNQASSALGNATNQGPGGCRTALINQLPVPDPTCTPGAENPTVTLEVLRNPAFRTGCLRDCVTTEDQKKVTYDWYSIAEPPHNIGNTQTCELDHLVPLELGGADTLNNIWPQCGPPGVSLNQRYFKQKDMVELYLADQVKAGAMDLEDARHGIATNWTQFLAQAKQYCSSHKCQ